MNAIGVISMSYARPFTAGHFPLFARMKSAGMDFCEILVPEPDELDPVEAGRAARGVGLSLALAARVNLQRDLASEDQAAHRDGIAYLHRCVDVAVACGARIVGGPLYGTPLVFAGRTPAPIEEDRRRRRVDRVVRGLGQVGNTRRITASPLRSSRSTGSRPISATPPARPAISPNEWTRRRSASCSTRST